MEESHVPPRNPESATLKKRRDKNRINRRYRPLVTEHLNVPANLHAIVPESFAVNCRNMGVNGPHITVFSNITLSSAESSSVPSPIDKDYGNLSLPSKFDDGKPIQPGQDIIPDECIPAHQDFVSDPSHGYWTWDVSQQKWFHDDPQTGLRTWAPLQLS
jgi:hypothetical protein